MSNNVIAKRRRFFLKDSSQPTLILKVYMMLLVVMCSSGGVFYFIGNKNLTQEFFKAHSVIETTMQLLLPALVAVNLIALLVASFLVISFSHSIAGPVYRLKNLSGRIAKGDLTVVVKFREKDAIQELSKVINDIIMGLNSRLKNLEGSLTELGNLSDKVENMNALSPEDLANLKDRILTVSSELEEKMKEFKL